MAGVQYRSAVKCLDWRSQRMSNSPSWESRVEVFSRQKEEGHGGGRDRGREEGETGATMARGKEIILRKGAATRLASIGFW